LGERRKAKAMTGVNLNYNTFVSTTGVAFAELPKDVRPSKSEPHRQYLPKAAWSGSSFDEVDIAEGVEPRKASGMTMKLA